MRDLVNRRGLKFPDEFLTRFFFKRGHNQRRGRVLELGCGNGCNLELYHAHGWESVGLDISEAALADAQHNLEGQGKFQLHDISSGLPNMDGEFDVVLMPSSMYYIPRKAFELCLDQLRSLLKPHADIYLRMRLSDDYRYGRGRKTELHGFILDTQVTGEFGALNVFYTEHELVALLQTVVGMKPDDMVLLHNRFENFQSGEVVPNSELIVWGRVNSAASARSS